MPSIVLCFGDDGHIAFEQSEDDYQCGDLAEQKNQFTTNHRDLSHQNDDCEDIPLINLLSTPFLIKDRNSKNIKLAAVETNIKTINAFSITHTNITNNSIITPPSSKCLQSIILLI
jgi:hypothetical protein